MPEGKRYRTKKERMRIEKSGPPLTAEGSLDYWESELPPIAHFLGVYSRKLQSGGSVLRPVRPHTGTIIKTPGVSPVPSQRAIVPKPSQSRDQPPSPRSHHARSRIDRHRALT